MTRKKDPLWSVVKILPTDYAGYGGEVPEDQKPGDCSCGCRWAAYLEQSGDWLMCTNPDGARFGLLTWEHQAGGDGCFEWGCDRCLLSGDDCKCPPEADLAASQTQGFPDALWQAKAETWKCRKLARDLHDLAASAWQQLRDAAAPDSRERRRANDVCDQLLEGGPLWVLPPAMLVVSQSPLSAESTSKIKPYLQSRGDLGWVPIVNDPVAPAGPDAEDPSSCWFCGKARREVKKLIAAESPPGRAPCCICDECVGLCYDLMADGGVPWSHVLRPEQYAALVAWAKTMESHDVEHLGRHQQPYAMISLTPSLLAVLAVADELRDRLRPADPPTTWGWSTSPDPEYWCIGDDGEGFATREAASDAARADDDFEQGAELWLITGARLRPSATVPSCDTIDVAQWMEDFVDDNYGADYAEGWPEVTPVAEVVFDELIEAWADRWLEPLPWRPTGKPERYTSDKLLKHSSPPRRVDQPYDTDGCICTETVIGKSECPDHGPAPALLPAPLTSVDGHHSIDVKQEGFPVPCRPEACFCSRPPSMSSRVKSCQMCGGTGQICATHARSWSLCKDERDKP